MRPSPVGNSRRYHVGYYSVSDDADWSSFHQFAEAVGARRTYVDYVEFSAALTPRAVLRKLAKSFREEFYYVVAFEEAGGGFSLTAYPEACLQMCRYLSAKDRADMMKCFDAVLTAIQIQTNMKLTPAEKRKKQSRKRSP